MNDHPGLAEGIAAAEEVFGDWLGVDIAVTAAYPVIVKAVREQIGRQVAEKARRIYALGKDETVNYAIAIIFAELAFEIEQGDSDD